MSTILVTGGSGFIGSHTILQLLADGHAVRNLNRESEVHALLKQGGAEPGDRLKFFAADFHNARLPPRKDRSSARRAIYAKCT